MDRSGPTKRLARELAEIHSDSANLPFQIFPLDDNFLCWHFTLSGPAESDYSAGQYHGKIVFPSDYPFTPPSVLFLTPNGRFETHMKVCLSFTGFHPEQWQPAWGVRTMLLALREHFRVEDRAAVGYLGQTQAERQRLAKRSLQYCCRECGYNIANSREAKAERRCQMTQGMLILMILAVAVLFVSYAII